MLLVLTNHAFCTASNCKRRIQTNLFILFFAIFYLFFSIENSVPMSDNKGKNDKNRKRKYGNWNKQ